MADSTVTAEDLDALAEGFELAADAWDELDEEQQAQVVKAVDAAWEGSAPKPGNGSKSEFQRQAETWSKVGRALQASAALSFWAPPVAAVLLALGTAFVWMGRVGNKLTVQRTIKLAAFLADKAPRGYALLCAHPWLLVGVAALAGDAVTAAQTAWSLKEGETFWLLWRCPTWRSPTATRNIGTGDAVKRGEVVTADDLAADMNSSSNGNSGAVVLGGLAAALLLLRK